MISLKRQMASFWEDHGKCFKVAYLKILKWKSISGRPIRFKKLNTKSIH